jgi:hypothetical protein
VKAMTISSFCRHLSKNEASLPSFQVRHTGECSDKGGGTSGFLHTLNGIDAISGFDRVKGILLVTDNDKMPKSFNDMQRILKTLKLPFPSHPTDLLTICGKPGALLMLPDHGTVGDLEALCWPAIVAKWPNADTCVPQFLQCTGAAQWAKPSNINKAKLRSAIIGNHEKDPYNTLGLLFKKVLSTAHSSFDAVARFLRDFDQMVGI